MIDMFALLVSTGMMGLVVFFAIRLNSEREWFEKAQPGKPPAKPSGRAKPPIAKRAIASRPGRGTPWRRDS